MYKRKGAFRFKDLMAMTLSDSRFFRWSGTNAALLVMLQPPLVRLSRTVWLAFLSAIAPTGTRATI